MKCYENNSILEVSYNDYFDVLKDLLFNNLNAYLKKHYSSLKAIPSQGKLFYYSECLNTDKSGIQIMDLMTWTPGHLNTS